MKRWAAVIMLLYITGSTAVSAGDVPECAELLRNRCQSCHYLSRVCEHAGERSKRKWTATLERMVERRGAELNKEEQVFLVDCLQAPASDIIKECKK